jgi:hypothetical protein
MNARPCGGAWLEDVKTNVPIDQACFRSSRFSAKWTIGSEEGAAMLAGHGPYRSPGTRTALVLFRRRGD